MRNFEAWPGFRFLLLTISVFVIKGTAAEEICADDLSWPCDTGNQCVDLMELCDGKRNCLDGSDESSEHCIQNQHCHLNMFRCSYGSCIHEDLRCNGQNDCADGSDELPALCNYVAFERQLRGNCSTHQIRCRSGECIAGVRICDSVSDCADGFDESFEVCATYSCARNQFQCGYGGCGKRSVACNGTKVCVDNLDESPVTCDESTRSVYAAPQFHDVVPTCRIPADKRFLIIEDIISGDLIPLGAAVSANKPLQFSCEAGYVLKGKNNTICKGGDKWTQGLPDCLYFCSDKHPRSGFSTKVSFELDVDVSSKSSFEPGTTAKVTCAPFYKRPKYFRETISCMDYGWNTPKVACDMRCGRPVDPLTSYSKGGENTEITEVPWHVGIYNRTGDKYENICGGTLISPRIVVSAAHCFFQAKRTKFTKNDWSTFSIAAGKYYREYEKLERDMAAVERRNIKNVWTHDGYNGAENGFYGDISIIEMDHFMTFSDLIRPACLYLPEEANQNIPSRMQGRVSTWNQNSLSAPISTLKTLHMETVSHGECNETLSQKSFLNIRGDKFCLASYGAEAVACKGDSGSGFVVRMPDQTFALFGIVSFSPTRTQECSRDQLLVMTNALFYKSWLQLYRDQDLANDVDFGSLH